MKRIRLLTLSVLLLIVVLGSAFSPRFAIQFYLYSGTNEYLPSNYTPVGPQAPIPGANNRLAWIAVDASEIYSNGLPMVDVASTTISSALNLALTPPKHDVTITTPVFAGVELKP